MDLANPPKKPHLLSEFDWFVIALLISLAAWGAYRFMFQYDLVTVIQGTTADEVQLAKRDELIANLSQAQTFIDEQNFVQARELLNASLVQVQTDLANEPILQAQVLDKLSLAALKEGDLPQATNWATQSVELMVSELTRPDDQIRPNTWAVRYAMLAARRQRIDVSLARQDHQLLIEDYQQLAMYYQQYDVQPSRDTAVTLQSLAMEYFALEDYVVAERIYNQALVLAGQLWPADSVTIGVMANDLGVIKKELGKYADAEALYLQAFDIFEKAGSGQLNNYINTAQNFVYLFEKERKITQAETTRAILLQLKAESAQ